MPYTLEEVLRQIDPYVQLNDGVCVSTVACRLMSVDCSDLTEYALGVDAEGRLLIYALDLRGFPIRPPVMIEQKPAVPAQALKKAPDPSQFGISIPGCV